MGSPHLLVGVVGLGFMDSEAMSVRGLVIVAVGYFAVVVYLFWLVIR